MSDDVNKPESFFDVKRIVTTLAGALIISVAASFLTLRGVPEKLEEIKQIQKTQASKSEVESVKSDAKAYTDHRVDSLQKDIDSTLKIMLTNQEYSKEKISEWREQQRETNKQLTTIQNDLMRVKISLERSEQ
jgi:hypothetical protein